MLRVLKISINKQKREFDKNPEQFFNALFKLNELNLDFRLNIIGEQFSQTPGKKLELK